MNAQQRKRTTLRWAGKTVGVVAATYLVLFGGIAFAARKGWLTRLDIAAAGLVPSDTADVVLGGALLTAAAGMAWAHAAAAPLAPYQTFYAQMALWLGMMYVIFLGLTQLLHTPTNPMSAWTLMLLTCAVTNAWWVTGIGQATMSKRERRRLDHALPFHIHAGALVTWLWFGVAWTLYRCAKTTTH